MIRKQKILLYIFMILIIFTACQSTPDENVVINKKDSIEEKVISNKEKYQETQVLKETQDVQIIQENTLNDNENSNVYSSILELNRIKVIIDAQVNIPDRDLQSVIITPCKLTQDFADNFVSYFSGDTQLYLRTTKEDIYGVLENEILLWEKNLFEVEHNWEKVKGKNPHKGSSKEEAIRYYNKILEQLNQRIIDAPKENNYIPTTSQLTNLIISAEDSDTGFEIIDTKSLMLDVYVKKEISNLIDSMARLRVNGKNGIADQLSYFNINEASSNGFMLTNDEINELGKSIKLPLEEAETYAKEAIEEIVKDEMILQSYWIGTAVKNGEVYPYYSLEYSRTINDVSIPHIPRSYILSNDVKYSKNYQIESLSVLVDESGVIGIYWMNLNEYKETLDDNVKIMNFDEIKTIFENQILIQPYSHNGDLEIVIQKVSLSLMPIKMKDSDDFVTIPVWDFLGYHYSPDDVKMKKKLSESNFDYSYLTISAIDGSTINRDIGY